MGALERFRRATSARDVVKCIDDTVQQVGLVGYAITTLGTQDTPGSRVVLIDRWERGWARTYQTSGFLDRDPIVAFAERRIDPFRWRDVRDDEGCSESDREIFEQAAEFGLREGIAIPLRSLTAAPAVASFGGGDGLGPDAMALLQIVAANAHARLTGVVIHSVPDTPERGVLTRRERECLQWCAEGKTSWEISQILSISQHTADWYLASAARKLAAANRLHAVAEALRRGLIS